MAESDRRAPREEVIQIPDREEPHGNSGKNASSGEEPPDPRVQRICLCLALVFGVCLVILGPACIASGISFLVFPDRETTLRRRAARAFSDGVTSWQDSLRQSFLNATKSGSIESTDMVQVVDPLSFSPASFLASMGTPSFSQAYLLSENPISLGPKTVVRDAWVGAGEGATVSFTDGIVLTGVGEGLPLFLWGSSRVSGSGAQHRCIAMSGDYDELLQVEDEESHNCFWYYRLDRLCLVADLTTGHPTTLPGASAESHGCYETQSLQGSLTGLQTLSYSVGAYEVVPDRTVSWTNFEIPVEVRTVNDPEVLLNQIVDTAVRVVNVEEYFEAWGGAGIFGTGLTLYVAEGVIGIVLLTAGIGMLILLGVLVFIQFNFLRKWSPERVSIERKNTGCLRKLCASICRKRKGQPGEDGEEEGEDGEKPHSPDSSVAVVVEQTQPLVQRPRPRPRGRGPIRKPKPRPRVFLNTYAPAKWTLSGVGGTRQTADPGCETYVIGSNTSQIPIYVLSDIHLRDDNIAGPHRRKIVGMLTSLAHVVGPKLSLRTQIPPKAYLVLLGDIFDSWVLRHTEPISLRAVIRKHKWFIRKITELREHGVLTVYVKGDKDSMLSKELCADRSLFNDDIYYAGERLIMGDVVFEHGNRYDLCATARYGDYVGIGQARLPVGYFISRMAAVSAKGRRDVWYHPLRAIFEEWLARQPRHAAGLDVDAALNALRSIAFPRLVQHLAMRGVGLMDRIQITQRTSIEVRNLFEDVGGVKALFNQAMLRDHAIDDVGVPEVFDTKSTCMLPLFCKTRIPCHIEQEMRIGIAGALGILDDVPRRFSPHFTVVVLAHTHHPVIKTLRDDDGYPVLYANSGSCEDSLAEWSVLRILPNLGGKQHRVERLRLGPEYELEVAKAEVIPKRTRRWYHGRSRGGKFTVKPQLENLIPSPVSFHLPGSQGPETIQCPGHRPGSLTSVERCVLDPQRVAGELAEREDVDLGWVALRESYPKLQQLFNEASGAQQRRREWNDEVV